MASGVVGERRISQFSRRTRRLSPPPAVLPEVLLGELPHPFFQKLRETNDDRVSVGVPVSGGCHLDRLDDDPILAVRQANAVSKEYGRVESQGEYRGAARGLGWPAQKRHVGRGEPLYALIRKKSDSPPR